MKNWINKFLDLTILFSYDHSGFKRHCETPLPLFDFEGMQGIITGASSGIGLAAAKALISQGMFCHLIARDGQKLKDHYGFVEDRCRREFHKIDLSHLSEVYSFASGGVKMPIDLLVHNAGSMPCNLVITDEGFELMFASQVLAPYILTRRLIDQGKLREDCRIIFVSSGGMYLQKLDLSDLNFEKKSYNKYKGYANAKRAQVILAELFSEKFPQYRFSAMHPGWVDTPGVHRSMPLFGKLLDKKLRSAEEGADTILWLASVDHYPNGKFWFDRKETKSSISSFYEPTRNDKVLLWEYCECVYNKVKEGGAHEPIIVQ